MSRTIEISTNKTLKLTNVVIYEAVNVGSEENENLDVVVARIDNYIKSKGAIPIGPLIQKVAYTLTDEGQLDVKAYLLRQANNFIHNIDQPYRIESVVRVSDCIYAHYVGPEESLKFAYDKINVTAFEEEISLLGVSYTIFVNRQDDDIVADVFMEKSK